MVETVSHGTTCILGSAADDIAAAVGWALLICETSDSSKNQVNSVRMFSTYRMCFC